MLHRLLDLLIAQALGSDSPSSRAATSLLAPPEPVFHRLAGIAAAAVGRVGQRRVDAEDRIDLGLFQGGDGRVEAGLDVLKIRWTMSFTRSSSVVLSWNRRSRKTTRSTRAGNRLAYGP